MLRSNLAQPHFIHSFQHSRAVATLHLLGFRAIVLLSLGLASLVSLPAAAAVAATATEAADSAPPSRVGRVGLLEGDVSFLSDSAEGWQRARINFPVTSRNSIWINGAGRAEVRIGASALRLANESVLDFIRIDDDSTRAHLQRGSLNIRLRSYAPHPNDPSGDDYRNGFRLDTTEGAITLKANGRYRLDVSTGRNETRLSVFSGRAKFETGDNALTVTAGKALIVRNQLGQLAFAFEVAAENPFDRWAEARDQQWDDVHARVVRTRELSPHMTGYEDLDAHGSWVDDREYGRLWTPRVIAAGWAPYRFGSWAYVRPWGWTWVDDAPWGFAPFHFGRWVIRSGRWFWWPGVYVRRPVYAPALVAWVSTPSTRIAATFGPSIGWIPLAPSEYYLPTYYRGPTYVRQINYVTNNVTIINAPTTYINAQPGTTIVNQGVVMRGEPVNPSIGYGPTVGGGQSTVGRVMQSKPLLLDAPAGGPTASGASGGGSANTQIAPAIRGEPAWPRSNFPSAQPGAMPAAPAVSSSPPSAPSAAMFAKPVEQRPNPNAPVTLPLASSPLTSAARQPANSPTPIFGVPGVNQGPAIGGEPAHPAQSNTTQNTPSGQEFARGDRATYRNGQGERMRAKPHFQANTDAGAGRQPEEQNRSNARAERPERAERPLTNESRRARHPAAEAPNDKTARAADLPMRAKPMAEAHSAGALRPN